MATAEDDIISLCVNQNFLGQDLCNVFYARVLSVDNPNVIPTGIARGFWDLIGTTWMANVVTGVTFTDIYAENLTNGIDFGTFIIGDTGDQVTSPLPSSVAYSVLLPRVNKITRSGGKRIVGVAESLSDGNTISQATADNISAIFEPINEPFDILNASMLPVGQAYCVLVGTDPVTKKPDPTRYQSMGDPVCRITLSTQNTRKPKVT